MEESGFLLINKPSGPTSHDIVYKLRKITNIKKIGHAGTLDPFANGLLIMAISRESTKQIDNFAKMDKEYITEIRLDGETKTLDTESEVTKKHSKQPTIEEIEKILKDFIGEQEQIPPMFSAKKVNGQKLYNLARKGIEIKREPNIINIQNIELLNYTYPVLTIKVSCSTGTYIRTLGHDIGTNLGCGGYLQKLKRTSIGKFLLKNAVDIENLTIDIIKDNLFKIDSTKK